MLLGRAIKSQFSSWLNKISVLFLLWPFPPPVPKAYRQVAQRQLQRVRAEGKEQGAHGVKDFSWALQVQGESLRLFFSPSHLPSWQEGDPAPSKAFEQILGTITTQSKAEPGFLAARMESLELGIWLWAMNSRYPNTCSRRIKVSRWYSNALAYKSHYNLSTATQRRVAVYGPPCQQAKQNSFVLVLHRWLGRLCNELWTPYCLNGQDLQIFRVSTMSFTRWYNASHRGTTGNYQYRAIIMAVHTFHLIGHFPFCNITENH